MSAPWGDGKPSRGFIYCSECSGEGVVYNNADPTSGQWVRCECAELLETNAALLEALKKEHGAFAGGLHEDFDAPNCSVCKVITQAEARP